MTRPKKKKLKIVVNEVKLGRQKLWGQTNCTDGVVDIDPRMKSKKYMRILLHESLHVCFPEMKEMAVRRASRLMRDVLWKQGYRRIKF